MTPRKRSPSTAQLRKALAFIIRSFAVPVRKGLVKA